MTAQEREFVEDIHSRIMETVEDFVPATDARRIREDLDALVHLLMKKAS